MGTGICIFFSDKKRIGSLGLAKKKIGLGSGLKITLKNKCCHTIEELHSSKKALRSYPHACYAG